MSKKLDGLIVIAVPIIFTVGFTILGSVFDYPDILRKPTTEVLARFRAAESQVLPAWWMMFLAACLFVFLVPLVSRNLNLGNNRKLADTLGIVAGVVQMLGLARWIFAVPILAKLETQAETAASARMLFEVLHTYLGVGLGEFSGYLFTAAWTFVISLGLLKANARIVAVIGIVCGAGILAGCLESFGVPGVGAVNAIAYLAWSLWMVWLGTAIFRNKLQSSPQHFKAKPALS